MVKPMPGLVTWLFTLLLVACDQTGGAGSIDAHPSTKLTERNAVDFVRHAEDQLAVALQENERTAWAYSNAINEHTERQAAVANQKFTAKRVELAFQAASYDGIDNLAPSIQRKLNILRSGITVPTPADVTKAAEQSRIGVRLSGIYGKGTYCFSGRECLDLGHLGDIMAESRDPEELLEAWNGWRTVSPPMKELYVRQVELANEAATELGFPDLGTMWRSAYDMPPDKVPAELKRLWGEVEPLYEALHCHVRARLGEFYGSELVPPDGLIPAHLLGNMWAQDWSEIYPLVAPREALPSYDLSATLKEKDFDATSMVKAGEAFFSSLGFAELPQTFWARSLFVQPEDRDVICHASAWNVDEKDDLRMKMCIKVNAEDFKTIHHELGHNYYQRAYNNQSHLYRSSANDGFHEAVGDTIVLSITPEYLHEIGLLESVPDSSSDIALLMQRALKGVAFLPFGLLVDQWRWQVFADGAGPEAYNSLWWQLRQQYQGIKAPNERPDDAFDAGAIFHVAANVPYIRYFLARILQYQFHRSLCVIAAVDGPVHRCSIYGSQKAGERLKAMLEMGRSQPWPDALEELTGQREMDATAILDYFAPLKAWLDEQNTGRQCGW